ncbi:hypothetical protein WR164_13120 [Philodulcilactobacillus myokoensis]|uniref:DUF4097 domain-containing protein n=1 Tax=Philodulcilactobacillus myokoensis TaxID=2929573 RepID=A0A9W6ETL1_9LACO|nr:DUF4097 family beta strand repeat-containing protein [Philodulcilactobacillus myokoensis]GLB47333.1 hypothetical protein WR164_13120 [Philodulcilactobacillus myokoensis]
MLKKILLVILFIFIILAGIATYNTIHDGTTHQTYNLKGEISTLSLVDDASDVQINAGNQNQIQVTKSTGDTIKPVLSHGNLDFTHQNHFDFFKLIRFGSSGSNIIITLTKHELKELYLHNSAGDTTINGINIKSSNMHSSAGDVHILNSRLDHTILKHSAGDLDVDNSTLGADDNFHSSAGDNTFTGSKFQYGYHLKSTAGDNSPSNHSNHFDEEKGTKISSAAGDNTIQ